MKPRYEKLSDELQERILSDRENFAVTIAETELRSGVQQR